MISLEKIRNRSGLLLFVIGIAMLAFILTDLLSSQNSGGSTDLLVGEVGEETIDYQSFEQRVQTTVENQKQSNPNINVEQVRNSVWNQLVREIVYQKEFDALGLTVSPTELFDMIQGDNPYPTIQQTFVNQQTGQFDRAILLQYLKEDIDNDETGQARKRWSEFETAIMKERLSSKYASLVSKGVNISDWEASIVSKFQDEVRNVSYVQIPFKSIADSLLQITDSDILSYMKDNSDDYQQEASRDIEYVVFTVNPSAEDRLDATDWIEGVKTEFSNSSDDASFVSKNSDASFSPINFVSEEALSNDVKSLYNSNVGTVVGPFKEGFNNLRLAKLVEVQNRPDSVKARHILITTPDAQSKIDSIKNLIQNGSSFSDLAKKLSEDTGSGADGGNLDWFQEGRMVAEFNEVCFTAKKGSLETIATQFGVHLIEVTDKSKTTKKVKVAYLDRNVVASNETYQAIFTKAGKFAAENNTTDEFNESSLNDNLSKRIASELQVSTTTIAGLESPRSLIRWANESSLGDVSDVFEFGNKFVVATLTKVNNEGLQDIEDAIVQVKGILATKKASEMLLDDLQDLQSLEQVSQDYGVELVSVAGLVFSNNQVPVLGQQPSFVGAAFAVAEGQTTKAFAGKNSVFVVRVDEATITPSTDFDLTKSTLSSSLSSKTNFQTYQALEDLTIIEDNRATYY
jgi:peptidyl-prolyl cis-trans isomerase D